MNPYSSPSATRYTVEGTARMDSGRLVVQNPLTASHRADRQPVLTWHRPCCPRSRMSPCDVIQPDELDGTRPSSAREAGWRGVITGIASSEAEAVTVTCAWLPQDDFVNHFAADVDPVRAAVMHAVQQALAGSTFTDVMGVPAWKSLPSWYLVATQDQAIPPDAERLFARRMGATTIEIPSSHVAMVSHPDQVAELITTAAQACATPTA